MHAFDFWGYEGDGRRRIPEIKPSIFGIILA